LVSLSSFGVRKVTSLSQKSPLNSLPKAIAIKRPTLDDGIESGNGRISSSGEAAAPVPLFASRFPGVTSVEKDGKGTDPERIEEET
jgi:hypothetical protein